MGMLKQATLLLAAGVEGAGTLVIGLATIEAIDSLRRSSRQRHIGFDVGL